MDADLDFVHPVFLRFFVVVTGVLLVGIVVYFLITQPISSFFVWLFENLEKNLNRLGLICQLVGLVAILPDLLEKKDAETWEKRLSLLGTKTGSAKLSFSQTIRSLNIGVLAQPDGVIGLVGHLSRTLGFVSTHLLAFSLFSTTSDLFVSRGLAVAFLILAYTWLLVELVNILINSTNNSGAEVLKLIRAATMWMCGGVMYFVPVLIFAILVVKFLEWVSTHSIGTILATITFPFIFIGTIAQLVAAFL